MSTKPEFLNTQYVHDALMALAKNSDMRDHVKDDRSATETVIKITHGLAPICGIYSGQIDVYKDDDHVASFVYDTTYGLYPLPK